MRALRSRLTLDRLALAVVLIGAVLVVASLVQGSDGGAARDRAVYLVPADALLYVHVHVEPNSDQWSRADEIVRQLPALRRLRDRALDNLSRAASARLRNPGAALDRRRGSACAAARG